MRRKLCSIICLFLLVVLIICSCTSQDCEKSTSSTITSSYFTQSPEETSTNHEYPMCQNQEFTTAMEQNPIDKLESLEPLSSLTIDLVNHYNKYIELWKKEEEFSLQNLEPLIDDENYDEIVKSQEMWKNSQEKRREVDYNILKCYMGKEFSIKRLQMTLDDARERTIYIKQLTYVIENMENINIPKEKQKWNVFLAID